MKDLKRACELGKIKGVSGLLEPGGPVWESVMQKQE